MIGFLGRKENQMADSTKKNTQEKISKERADKYNLHGKLRNEVRPDLSGPKKSHGMGGKGEKKLQDGG